MGKSRPNSATVLAFVLAGFLALASATGLGATKKRSSLAKPASAPAAASKQQEYGAPAVPPGLLQTVPEIPPDLTELPLVAKGAVVVDCATGQILYGKNADGAQYPASTTKIMTALLVIEAGNLDQEIDVTEEDSKVGESSLDIKPGDKFTRLEGLYGLMLKSANDVAHALGRDNAGSIEAFAEKMTQRAKELGATNTHFANPHGLHDIQHYTSPHDLALIARAAMQQPLFRQIVSTQFHSWNIGPPGTARQLRNHNRLLWAFPGCTGVKTGYTYPAQQVLVSAAHWGCREVVAVVMHSEKPGILEDSRMLLTWGLEHEAPPEGKAPTEPPPATPGPAATAVTAAAPATVIPK
jgi:D-alanyl-D-alanine carboxypeptidase (penicillin-binding protein 5/6)